MSDQVRMGDFLRARRAGLAPADVGLPSGGRRRAPGLRREELAALAGVSVDYYNRLEQGRERNPSAGVLHALAAVLRLNEEECAHLFALAQHAAQRVPTRVPTEVATGAPTEAGPTAGPRDVRPGIRQLLETVRPFPAYVLSRYSDVLAANPEALALFVGLADWPEERRNTVRYFFRHPAARELFPDWAELAPGTVANLHSVTAHDPQSPQLRALVDELTDGCPEFGALWARHEVRERRGEAKTFHHPTAGVLTLTSEILRHGDQGQRITLYQAPPGSPDHAALARLCPGG
ncbi:helix-turn-helix transcriptional regulator [Kitasatospora sp. NPDC097643]|uniref:helix-turn-helix domain-containing protein n=1 Tax=Kitasatospora sp. NPDC097643 TaxID=3157230 RepID=UPI0033253327